MDPTTALSMILSLIPDHLITSGGRLIRAGLTIGGSYISGETLDRLFNFYGGARKKRRLEENKWIKFIKFMRSVFHTFQQPNRFKVAREIYRKLVENGQIDYAIRFHKLPKSLTDRLKEIFVIKPTEKLQKYTWDDTRYFIHEEKLKEKPPTAITLESALVKLEQQPSLSLEHPSAGIFTQISEKKAEKKIIERFSNIRK
jgi:hypothetical protein